MHTAKALLAIHPSHDIGLRGLPALDWLLPLLRVVENIAQDCSCAGLVLPISVVSLSGWLARSRVLSQTCRGGVRRC